MGEAAKKSTSIFLQIVEHPDGSITRPPVPNVPPTNETSTPVLSKDLVLNPSHNTKLRLYLPNPIPETQHSKLPIVVYYHGGGFILFSPDFAFYHQFCERLASTIPAIVVSLDYRLAPENRLPAAYDDAVEALLWLNRSTDPWISKYGDFNNCFIAGSSSGGNMAYFAGLRSAKMDLGRVKVNGIVLIQPYFGGAERTRSEVESEEDDILPLRANEMMWQMALPKGSNRDHEYCNPLAKTMTPAESEVIHRLPRTILFGCKGDPLFDRQERFAEAMKKYGMKLTARMDETGFHAIELFDPARAEAMCAEIKDFIYA